MDNYRFVFKDDSIESVGEIKNGRLILHKNINNQIEGNIYRARVESYIKSMDAFILNIGEFKNAILKRKNINSNFKTGDDIIVEIILVPENDKLIEVTQSISISDGYIILLPFIKSKSTKIHYDLEIPYMLRTKTENLSREEIQVKYNKLIKIYHEIEKAKNELPTPKLLRRGKYLNNFCLDYDGEIISNYKFDYATIVDKNFNPKYNQEISMSISKLSNRKIDIDKTSIFVDKLEALTVIDVNSGGADIEKQKEEMSISTNLSVLDEIAIQVSLREIKKMLLIDFIRVNESNKEKIIEKLKEKFIYYNINAKILGFSRLELLEIIVF